MKRALSLFALAALQLGCVGTTGSDLFTFDAAAAGPADAKAGEPLDFTTPRGFDVSLRTARMHVGAVYLNKAAPISGAQATNCILPGIYVAEATSEIEIDLLDPTPAPFPDAGEAIGDLAVTGEVWLTEGDVDAPESSAVVLDLAGTAKQGDDSWPFEASVTIGANRVSATTDPSQPNAHPICKERIVSPIPLDLLPVTGGSLLLRVDPRGFFSNVDFSALTQVSSSPKLYRFRDDDGDQPSSNLYLGLHSRFGVYGFSWVD